MDMATFAGLTEFGRRCARTACRTCSSIIPCATRMSRRLLARRQRQPERLLSRGFIDEIASATGQEPLAFRRRLMANHPRHLRVLTPSQRRSAGAAPPKGVFRGIAQHMAYRQLRGGGAEISVSDSAKIKIHRIVGAIDPGLRGQSPQIERQAAGSFVYGLSALFWRMHGQDGRIEQSNFDTYNSMHCRDAEGRGDGYPPGGFWGGVGEPTICVAAPAVLNALFAATQETGSRSVPLKTVDRLPGRAKNARQRKPGKESPAKSFGGPRSRGE